MKFVVAALAALSLSASAAPLTYNFTAHVSFIGDTQTLTDLSESEGRSGGTVKLNDEVVGQFIYDPASTLFYPPWDPVPDPSSTAPGVYFYGATLNQLHFTVGSDGDHFGGNAGLTVNNDQYMGDALELDTFDDSYLNLVDPSANVFTNGFIPGSISFGDFALNSVGTSWTRSDGHYIIMSAMLDSFDALDAAGTVPEPGSLSLVLLGLCAIGAGARRVAARSAKA